MPLLEPDAPEENMMMLDDASAHFLRVIKQYYTRDTAVEVMDALSPILGKDWKGRVIFGLVANKHTGVRHIRLTGKAGPLTNNKITAIKEVRYLSGMGLMEAKTTVESAEHTPTSFSVSQKPMEYDQVSWDRRIQNSIEILRGAGYSVEFT